MEEKIYIDDLCCICLEKLGKANSITFRCGHMCIHASCFNSGMSNCPICRQRISDEPPPIPAPPARPARSLQEIQMRCRFSLFRFFTFVVFCIFFSGFFFRTRICC